ncbi:hypothetical protein [Streptomyces sp. NPDC019890]|uniref:hypothetical protein n=1 Tax=Streptomyces sp. NPDC019890 TaxID=3365064 RepID=UPI00384A78EF
MVVERLPAGCGHASLGTQKNSQSTRPIPASRRRTEVKTGSEAVSQDPGQAPAARRHRRPAASGSPTSASP